MHYTGEPTVHPQHQSKQTRETMQDTDTSVWWASAQDTGTRISGMGSCSHASRTLSKYLRSLNQHLRVNKAPLDVACTPKHEWTDVAVNQGAVAMWSSHSRESNLNDGQKFDSFCYLLSLFPLSIQTSSPAKSSFLPGHGS